MTQSSGNTVDFDVVIVGAGISGINTAYHVQTRAPKGTSYAIFEGRGVIGGTWDLFRYPGIRTDSDVHTFGFSWHTWAGEKPLAAGQQILNYMQQAATSHGIDKNIRFRHKVLSADWDSKLLSWSIKVLADGQPQTFRASFIILGTGYYDYDEPLAAEISGIERFKGPVIHPQFWPEAFDYCDKRVVIIGSGATAITLVPAMSEEADHVTMLQRSPSYVYSLPTRDLVGTIIRKILPHPIARRINRLRWVFLSNFLYSFCTWFPKVAKFLLTKAARKQLPSSVSWHPHFNPRYDPWQQRLCFCPDGDFYSSLRSGKADVVTGIIKDITANAIELQSGEILHPDIIVTATGLNLKFGGGVKLSVDQQEVDPTQRFMWKGSLLQDVPNMVFILGYFNASFTLGADVTAELLVRLLCTIHKKGARAIIPRIQNLESTKEQSVTGLTSTYVTAGASHLPKGGQGMWAPKSSYFPDMLKAKWGSITKDLEFLYDESN